MKFNTFLILLLISFNTIQCRKDIKLPYCEEFPEDCVEIMTVKDHFYFDVGTYWVYEEETTGQLDSQWVSRAFTYANVCWFDYDIKTSLNNSTSEISTQLRSHAIDRGLVRKDIRTIDILRSKIKPGKLIGNSYLASFYYNVGDSLNNWGGGGYGGSTYYSQLRIYDIYDVYDVFKNVIKIGDDYNIAENSQPTIHLYAKNIGLIRKELIDSNQVWNLIRYNIVK